MTGPRDAPSLAADKPWEVVVRLCGQISVELEVGDYIEAADHQQRLESLLRQIRGTYPGATLALRERRQRKPLELTPAPAAPVAAGRLAYGEG